MQSPKLLSASFLRAIEGACEIAEREVISFNDAVWEFRRVYVMMVLRRLRGNQCNAAEEIGIHRNTLARIMDQLDIPSSYGRGAKHRVPRFITQRAIDERKASASEAVPNPTSPKVSLR